eukprot:356944-Chlamydomonas_euryale.AAC.3
MAVGKNKRISKGKKGGKKKASGKDALAAETVLGTPTRRRSFCQEGLVRYQGADHVPGPQHWQDPLHQDTGYQGACGALLTGVGGNCIATRGPQASAARAACSPAADGGLAHSSERCCCAVLQIASETLKNRVFEVSLADLQKVSI